MSFRLPVMVPALVAALVGGACTQSHDDASLTGQPEARGELAGADQALAAPTTYLIVYKAQALPATAGVDIARAGGKLVSSFPAIGVVVAHGACQWV